MLKLNDLPLDAFEERCEKPNNSEGICAKKKFVTGKKNKKVSKTIRKDLAVSNVIQSSEEDEDVLVLQYRDSVLGGGWAPEDDDLDTNDDETDNDNEVETKERVGKVEHSDEGVDDEQSSVDETFVGFEEEMEHSGEEIEFVDGEENVQIEDSHENDEEEESEEEEEEPVLRRSRRTKWGTGVYTYDELGKDPKISRYKLILHIKYELQFLIPLMSTTLFSFGSLMLSVLLFGVLGTFASPNLISEAHPCSRRICIFSFIFLISSAHL